MSISPMVSFWAFSPLSFAFSVTQCSAVASNRPTEALASVISLAFVVYST